MSQGPRSKTVRLRRGLVAALVAVAAAGAPAAHATTDLFYDASLALKISDDARFFLNVTNRYYGSQQQAVPVLNRCPNPDVDFPVVMFLAQISGKRADAVLSLRRKNISWSEVMVRLQVPPDRLFAGLDRDPGPPYGHAWGHYRDHRGDARNRFDVDDRTVQDLVRLQIASGALRVSPYSIVSERQRGMTVDRFVVIHSQPSGVVEAKSHGPRERGQGHNGQGHKKPHP
ncbi:MAG TPA: hypothetical protein VFQ07_02200 [Candidatus Polarisedimenticolia bacterium]|nr:hypothetical protein [Candidatus Polarisedimenticolia bacterium]